MHQNRDFGINYMRTRKNHTCYGMGIGIMVLDDAYPGFPGDVRNASAWGFPIQYEIAEGVDNHTLVWEEDKTPCREPILRAAKKLERMGCRAIAAECGYFAYFQKDVAGYVDVPVFMSSLLQVPFIQQVIGPRKTVGIVCAQKRFLTDTHLKNAGIDPTGNIVIAGAQDEYGCPQFDTLWDHEKRPEVPESFYDQSEKDMVRICRDFCRAHPGIGAIMLECTGMQPFARAVQREVDLPVFSWGTLLDYAYSVVAHRDYYGHV
ncbi:aspartate/glutamate racemase family protein [Desulfococcus sp.]|uniref:aspartate/glutamate racemase family protein n=1 Tax=Desulfococcus sp. TaxID=2025834 RepID=UPI003593FD4D